MGYICDDVIKWKQFPCCWSFVRGIHRSPADSPHWGQWRGPLVFSLIYAWTNRGANNRDAGDSRHHRAHYDVTVMFITNFAEIWPCFNGAIICHMYTFMRNVYIFIEICNFMTCFSIQYITTFRMSQLVLLSWYRFIPQLKIQTFRVITLSSLSSQSLMWYDCRDYL